VKPWVALGVTPFDAVTVIGKVPVTLVVPLSTPAELNVTPLGSVPVSLNVIAVGKPVAVIVNVLGALATNDVVFALVITGA
jgi:hypothetical protein